MSHNIKKPATVLQFLNKKGQGIVEFALVLAFCAGIGMAAREAGLAEALDAAFAGTSSVAAPKDIQPGVSTGSEGSTTTVTIDQSNKVPEKTDAKYASMTSDEAKDLNFINDLKKYYEDHTTDNTLEDDIWNAYKGDRQFADAEAEARAKNVGLALLGKNLSGENAVTDAVWKDLKADNNWAFDTDDQTIHTFLNNYKTNTEGWDVNDPDKLNGYIDDLQTRNVYFANLEANDIANMLKNIGKTSFVNSAGNGSDFYDGYLAIKKQFWSTDASGNNTAKAVALDLAPLITDAAFAATSDEKKIFNYVNGVNGTKGVVPYFEQYAGSKLTDAGVRLAKELEAFKQNNPYAVDDANDDNDNLTTAMFSVTKIENVSDDYWIQVKKNIGWVLDEDDSAIKAKLTEFITTIISEHENETLTNDEIITELKERNTQFHNLDNSSIASMISNLGSNNDNLDENSYTGYLAIKKQFWQNNKYQIGENDLTLADKQSSGGGDAGFETVKSDIETRKNNAEEWPTQPTAGNGISIAKNVGEMVSFNGITYVVNQNFSWRLDENNYFSPTGNNSQAFTELSGDYIGDSDILTTEWGAKIYPTLKKGDIVITADGSAYLIQNPGNYYTPDNISGTVKIYQHN